jgi:hypothetical protein
MVDDRHAAPMSLVRMSDYVVHLEGGSAGAVVGQIPAFLEREVVDAVKKTKSGERTVNARPLVLSLEAMEAGRFRTRLMLTESQSIKPELLVGLLSNMARVEAPMARVHRTMLLGLDAAGNPAPLMTL